MINPTEKSPKSKFTLTPPRERLLILWSVGLLWLLNAATLLNVPHPQMVFGITLGLTIAWLALFNATAKMVDAPKWSFLRQMVVFILAISVLLALWWMGDNWFARPEAGPIDWKWTPVRRW